MKERRDLFKTAVRVITSIGILAFVEGLLTTLTGSLAFVFILPIVFILVGYIISLIM